MAKGRPPDDGPGHTSRRQRRRDVANADGLAALGKQMGSSSQRPASANESGLKALGERIEGKKGRRQRQKWSTKRKVVTALSTFVALVVVLAAAGYGFIRYEFDRITRANCPACVAVAGGQPYNVLVIGSDTRDGETAAEAKQFGNASDAGGQRSDTIKIIHVDPQTGTASTLSIPRDTLVTLSGVPKSSGVSNPNKINAAFATGPNDPDPAGTGANGLVKTIEHSFGIPISHWIVVNFFGLMDAVNALNGVNMDLPFPIRDYGDCNGNGVYENCTGLDILKTGCQSLSGTQALELSRSRHFEWYQDGEWQSDLSGDLGRIERQDLLIEAVVNKAKSTYNPIRAVTFVNSMTHDVTLDKNLSVTALLSLAQQYHAFSGSSLVNFTLPTSSAYFATYGEDVETVNEPAAAVMINQFLGAAPNSATTPPLDANGDPEDTSLPVTTTTAPSTSTSAAKSTSPTTKPADATTSIPAYDPRPC
ncbi:MAG TPA: LCP family protein [Acidimicrobiales bacterium]|jgi:LCP family protein required for cell wall assembly